MLIQKKIKEKQTYRVVIPHPPSYPEQVEIPRAHERVLIWSNDCPGGSYGLCFKVEGGETGPPAFSEPWLT